MKSKVAQKTYSIIALVAAAKTERDIEFEECFSALEFLTNQVKAIEKQIAFYRMYEDFYQSTIQGLENDKSNCQDFVEILSLELIKIKTYQISSLPKLTQTTQ